MKCLVCLALASRPEDTEILQQACLVAAKSLQLRQLVPWSMVNPIAGQRHRSSKHPLPLMLMHSQRIQPPTSKTELQTHRLSCLPDLSTWLFCIHKSSQFASHIWPVFPDADNIPYLSLHPFMCSPLGERHAIS